MLPQPVETQSLRPEAGAAPGGNGPALWAEPATGPLGTPAKLLGRGLTPGAAVDLTWAHMVGNDFDGWKEQAAHLGQAVVAPDGTIALGFKAPDDLGGFHRLEALSGDQKVAEGSFILTPSVFALEPARGPVGTTFRVHMKGVS